MQNVPFPPRGSGRPESPETAPRGQWLHPEDLNGAWEYGRDSVLLGCHGSRFLGRRDDRHIVTIAGSRAGKSRTVLIPNLLHYRGSVVVIDPKGELALHTAETRSQWSDIVVLNPFKVMGWPSHHHDPFAELQRSETPTADAAQLADALVIDNEKDPHWTDSAKNLITGIILQAFTTTPNELSIRLMRRQLTGSPSELLELFNGMRINEALGGAIQNIGSSMYAKFSWSRGGPEPSDELLSILSTANEQTRPLDDLHDVFSAHDFYLDDLSRRTRPITIYLILPATRIVTHSRWLRLFIYQLLAALERKPFQYGSMPLWLILEEFAALGHMRGLEAAAGYFAGFGIKLWTILQDLTQIKTHYPKSWETFLGNAGTIQAFGILDATTTKYFSDLPGPTNITEYHQRFVNAAQYAQGDDGLTPNLKSVPLLTPSEIAYFFARETKRQLLLVPGSPPIYMSRLDESYAEGF